MYIYMPHLLAARGPPQAHEHRVPLSLTLSLFKSLSRSLSISLSHSDSLTLSFPDHATSRSELLSTIISCQIVS